VRAPLLAALLLVVAGCGPGDERAVPADEAPPAGGGPVGGLPVIPGPGEGLRAPVDVVPRSYLARPVEQDYVEVVPREEAGPVCALLVQPRVRTPREGPWTITFRDPRGEVAATLPPQRVDTATGYLTLVAHTPFFGVGEWTIELDLVEGGLTHGPERQVFRFRVE
jgi:hypothetical protein